MSAWDVEDLMIYRGFPSTWILSTAEDVACFLGWVGCGVCLLSRKEKGPNGGDISLLQELVLSQGMGVRGSWIAVRLSQHEMGRGVEQMFSVRATALIWGFAGCECGCAAKCLCGYNVWQCIYCTESSEMSYFLKPLSVAAVFGIYWSRKLCCNCRVVMALNFEVSDRCKVPENLHFVMKAIFSWKTTDSLCLSVRLEWNKANRQFIFFPWVCY